MNISKDDYILRAFSKIQHKKWELYVITRIIHLLDDPELEFVCQQLIKTPDHKRYLADLCFPELELYCEVDELQHSSEEHAIADENRMKEIIDASNFIEKRIQIYNENLKIKELKEINEEIDSLIQYIKDRKQEYIAGNNFNPWDYYNKYNPDVHIERGYIDTKDNVSFLYHRDALRCFGYDGGHFQHQRNVSWSNQYINRDEMSESLRNSSGSIGTVSNLTSYANEIESLIDGNVLTSLSSSDESVEDPTYFALEKHLEDFLIANWSRTRLGEKYQIYSEEGEIVGQQYPSDTGPIDILAISNDGNEILVVELKKGRASDSVVGQIQRYMGYVKDVLAEDNQTVSGVIIAAEDDQRIRRALSVTQNISFMKYSVKFELNDG